MRDIREGLAPLHATRPRIPITAVDEEGQREEQEEDSRRYEGGYAPGVRSKGQERAQCAEGGLGDRAEQREGAVEEGNDEEETNDRADVADGSTDTRKTALLLRRDELGQHGVVKGLCRLIAVVRDDERE